MPGFDGTGPRGAGPMTGGARGFCGAGKGPDTRSSYGVGRGGMPRGGGRGRLFGGGRGCGRGMGRGFWNAAGASAAMPAREEREFLNERLSFLEEEIVAVRKRLEALDRDEDDSAKEVQV